VDYFGLQGRVDVEIGTLSKAFGVVGGFAAGSKLLAELLKQKPDPYFSLLLLLLLMFMLPWRQ